MRGLKVEGSDENGRVSDEPDEYPDRPGEPDCIYYLRTGACGYGINCRYNHHSDGGQVGSVKNTIELPERAGQPDCGFYLNTSTCKYGSICKYHHPKDKQPDDAMMNVVGLPMRQDAKVVSLKMRNGFRKCGSACKFHHPQPALNGVYVKWLSVRALFPFLNLSKFRTRCLVGKLSASRGPIFERRG